MNKKSRTDNAWISSLLNRHDLFQPKKDVVDSKPYFAQVEECQLIERIGNIVADINGTAGYRVLELLDFAPPRDIIVLVTYSKRLTEYVVKIVVRESGAAVVFYSQNTMWERYFPNHPRLGKRTTSLVQEIHPAEISNEDLQRWFSYLLSGFDKKLTPNAT